MPIILAVYVVGIVSTVCQGLLAGRLARRFGEARVLAVGCLIFGAGLVGQVLVGRQWLIRGLPWSLPYFSEMDCWIRDLWLRAAFVGCGGCPAAP